MNEPANILISIKAVFLNKIFAGTKTVELRRRSPRVSPGTRVWIYEKAPTASIRAIATLSAIETMSPDSLWVSHGRRIVISYDEYRGYLSGSSTATAMLLSDVQEIHPISLKQLKVIKPGFHPPQFYLNLDNEDALKRGVKEAANIVATNMVHQSNAVVADLA